MIFLSFFMILYLVYRWILKRIPDSDLETESSGEKEHSPNMPDNLKEGLDTIPYPSADAFADSTNLPLKEYAIKSSMNSTYDGTAVSIDQLATIMYKGYRFIDLNVFMTDSSNLYVGFSADNAPTMVDVSLPFHKAIDYINSYAFQLDTNIQTKVQAADFTAKVNAVINPNVKSAKTIQDTYTTYPLFLNIRVYRPPNSTADIISLVYDEISKMKKLYVDGSGTAIKISQYTPLSDIMGKIVVSMDIENILEIYASPVPYDPAKIPPETKQTIDKMASIKTGGDNWSTFYSYADVAKNPNMPLVKQSTDIQNPSYETNAIKVQMAYPSYNETSSNPDTYDFLSNHQIQCIPVRAYISDLNLDKYVKLFDQNKTPFLPLYVADTFLKKSNTKV